MTKTQIQADLLTVLCPISAQPGDKLVVYNGNVIGLYRRLDEAELAQSKTKTKVEAKAGLRPAAALHYPITDANIRWAIECGNTTTYKIGNHLGIEVTDREKRGQLGRAIRKLVDEGKLVRLEDPSRKRNAVWAIAGAANSNPVPKEP